MHPNIVTVFDADVWDGRPAIVMEMVEGPTLSQLMAREGPLLPMRVLSILDQLLDAVAYSHEHGVIHRDIKPDNVCVSRDGMAKLADFGIANMDWVSITDRISATEPLTNAGDVLGTLGYMSPEQAKGYPVDERSDLFSVAVVAYEMLSGRNPFGEREDIDPVTLLYRIVHYPVPMLPPTASAGLSFDMRPAIMAALSKDPSARPSSACEFKAMLHGEGRQRGRLCQIRLH